MSLKSSLSLKLAVNAFVVLILPAAPACQQRPSHDTSAALSNQSVRLVGPPCGGPLGDLSQLSKINNAHDAASLGPLSQDEKALTEKIQNIPIAFVTRMDLTALGNLLANEELLSTRLSIKNGLMPADQKVKTPLGEDELFGALDCVFISVGTRAGIPKYGDYVVFLKGDSQDIQRAWATRFSGWKFFKNAGLDTEKIDAEIARGNASVISSSVKNDFAAGAFTPPEWRSTLSRFAIKDLRELGEGQKLLRALNKISDPDQFWYQIEKYRLSYLEGKIPQRFSLQSVDHVWIPEYQRAKVMALPGAAKWKDLIKDQPNFEEKPLPKASLFDRAFGL